MGLNVLLWGLTISFLTNIQRYGLVQSNNINYAEDSKNKQEENQRQHVHTLTSDSDHVSGQVHQRKTQTRQRDLHLWRKTGDVYQRRADKPFDMDFRNAVSQEQGSVDNFTVFNDFPTHADIRKEIPDCFHLLTTLICPTIPTHIPPGVTTLKVTNQDDVFPAHPFRHFSFANLSILSWNGLKLNEFSESTFEGLDCLGNLTITGMDALDGSSLQLAILSAGVLPKLKYFALNPGEKFKWPFVKVETRFLEKLANNSLDCFNISNVISKVNIRDLAVFSIASKLSVVNFTGSFLMIDFSHSYGYMDSPLNHLSNLKPLVQVLDVSRVRTANITDSNTITGVQMNTDVGSPQCNGTHPIYPVFALVDVLYAKKIYSGPINVQGICSYNNVLLRKIVFSSNNLVKLNLTVLLPHNNSIYYIDISDNELEYINPKLFSAGFFIQELYLSSNKLNLMEHSQEFENLLATLVRLEVFDLANNNISFIPPKMFRSNKRLNTLILANNRLTSISFELGHLKELFELDLRDNAIATLDYTALNTLFHTRKENVSILFAGNPIQCLCESVDFIRWLVSLHEVSKEIIYCNYKSDYIIVDKGAIEKCEYLCNRTLIIAVSTGCTIVTVALILSTTLIIRHFRLRKRKRNVEWRLRQLIDNGNFVCFMAVSGNDETLVNRVILDNLQRLLKTKVGIERNLVCTGTRFKPGFPICEEAYRLMKKSHVFVAVVSESFMRSQYCKLELQEACKQNKPTILIILGHVDTEDMPQYMQEVFRRNSRAWIKQNDEGYYYVVPNIIDLTDAIWDLAIEDLLHGT